MQVNLKNAKNIRSKITIDSVRLIWTQLAYKSPATTANTKNPTPYIPNGNGKAYPTFSQENFR